MAWTAADNSRLAGKVASFDDPAGMLRVHALGTPEASALLRHEASEITRGEREIWEYAQLALGAFLFSFLLFGTPEGKVSLALALLMVVGTAAQTFGLGPQLDSLGRLTDFMSSDAASGYHARLLVMQGAYFGVEIGKWTLGAILAAILIGRRGTRSGDTWQQFNVINKANHRHVDR